MPYAHQLGSFGVLFNILMSENKFDEDRITRLVKILALLGPEATSCLISIVSLVQSSHWIKFLVRGSGLKLLPYDPGLWSSIPLCETSAICEYAGVNP